MGKGKSGRYMGKQAAPNKTLTGCAQISCLTILEAESHLKLSLRGSLLIETCLLFVLRGSWSSFLPSRKHTRPLPVA